MNKNYDEPRFSSLSNQNEPDERKLDRVKERIGNLIQTQPFGVLSTQANGQPYTTLVGFVASQDFLKIAFATPTHTRKYEHLIAHPEVALLLDNRSDHADQIHRIFAVTAVGEAREIEDAERKQSWIKTYTAKQPYLENFVTSKGTALFEIVGIRYFYVQNFQEVFEWTPE